ncbi:MAG: GNAT family N-acetyltransferase [Gemmatirosa sp.]
MPDPASRGPDMLPDADRLPTIPTERLRIRALTGADVPALFAVFGDPVVCRYWSRPALPDLAAAEALHDEIAQLFVDRTLFQWGIAERATDAIVGTCTLASLTPAHRRAEVGFALARAAWGRGYVAEVLPALLTFAFAALGLHRVEADVDPRNGRSIRALERVGFVREGLQRERYLLHDEWQDAVLYGLLRRDWARSGRPHDGGSAWTTS